MHLHMYMFICKTFHINEQLFVLVIEETHVSFLSIVYVSSVGDLQEKDNS